MLGSLSGEGLPCPMLAGRCLGSIDPDHPDREVHAPVLYDEGVTVYDPEDLVLTSDRDGREQEGKDQEQCWEDLFKHCIAFGGSQLGLP